MLLSEFIIPMQVVKGKRFLPMHTYSLLSFSTIPSGFNNQIYSCTYPPRIEQAGMVEKVRDSDRESEQGQPEASASLALCMCNVCRVRGLGPSCTPKQNILSLILLIPLAKLTNQKRGICRHCILYPLRLRPLFPNDARTLRPKIGLGPNQITY